MSSIVQIDKENLMKLVSEVKETIATDINYKNKQNTHKKFGIVDMWNCKRSMRTASSLRRH